MSTHNSCFQGEKKNIFWIVLLSMAMLCLFPLSKHMLLYVYTLTHVLLRKLRCHAHFQFLANQIT